MDPARLLPVPSYLFLDGYLAWGQVVSAGWHNHSFPIRFTHFVGYGHLNQQQWRFRLIAEWSIVHGSLKTWLIYSILAYYLFGSRLFTGPRNDQANFTHFNRWELTKSFSSVFDHRSQDPRERFKVPGTRTEVYMKKMWNEWTPFSRKFSWFINRAFTRRTNASLHFITLHRNDTSCDFSPLITLTSYHLSFINLFLGAIA